MCNGFRGRRAHQHSCRIENVDELKDLFTIENMSSPNSAEECEQNTDTPVLLPKIPLKDGIKLPSSKQEWVTANTYFHQKLNLTDKILDLDCEVDNFHSCIYDYFKSVEKVDKTPLSEFTELIGLSRRQLKKLLKSLKTTGLEDDLPKIRAISKLLRVKYSKKGFQYRNELSHDTKIEKHFWKYCKEIFEDEEVILATII